MLDKTENYENLPSTIMSEPGAGLTIQTQVNGRRTIIFQTAIARDQPAAEFHALVDKLSAVVDRQEWKFDLQGLRIARDDAQKNMELAHRQAQAIEEKSVRDWDRMKKKGAWKLSETEETSKRTFLTNIDACKKNIAKIEEEIAELEAKIAKVD